jgi:biotin transport system substrate-specific component
MAVHYEVPPEWSRFSRLMAARSSSDSVEEMTAIMPNILTPALIRERLLPREGALPLVILAVLGSLFTAVCAQISIQLPFSPVPITGQTLAVLLTGAVLGARAGGLAQLCYLGEGASGLPVFAGGTSGPAMLAGATAGYLWAFPAAAFVAGAIVDCLGKPYPAALTLPVLLLADGLVFVGGVAWLAVFLHVDIGRAATLGLWPYLPGDLAKIILVAITMSSGREMLKRFGWGVRLR